MWISAGGVLSLIIGTVLHIQASYFEDVALASVFVYLGVGLTITGIIVYFLEQLLSVQRQIRYLLEQQLKK